MVEVVSNDKYLISDFSTILQHFKALNTKLFCYTEFI